MLWDAGLLLAVGVCAGIAVDFLARPLQPYYRSVPALALCGLLWAGGELLLRHAQDPAQVLWARRILFAGVCALGPAMLFTAARLRHLRPSRVIRFLLIAAIVCELVVYGSLFFGRAELFIHGPPGAPVRGPLFALHAVFQWGLIAAAIALFASATASVRGRGRLGGAIVLAGAGLPLVLNWLYLGLGISAHDPTPIVFSVGALSIRWGILDLVGVPFLAALARSELLDQLDAGVFVADGRGRVLEANRAARMLLPGVDLVDAYLSDVLGPLERDPGFDVRRFPLSRHGRRVGVGAVVGDRRERAAEQSAEVATRMEALGVLTRGLAQEINNPLATVLGGTGLLHDRLRAEHGLDLEASGVGDLLRNVDEGGERIAGVVRRMTLIADAGDEAYGTSAEVGEMAERAIALACLGQDRQRVRLTRPRTRVRAAVRPTELLQILLHAIGNALESSEPSGAPVEVHVEPAEDTVAVRVLDRGPGFPEGDPSRIFHPFESSKRSAKGLGLGLSLCWELAHKNGGSLEALRRPEGGTELRLELAASDPTTHA